MSVVSHLINGELVESQRTLDVTNPSTGKVVRQVADASAADVERAIAAAQAAFPAWRDTPPAKRAQVMYRFKQLLEEHADRLVQLVSEEHGKTVEDAMGELKRGIENVEYACGVPELLKGEYFPQRGAGNRCLVQLPAAGRGGGHYAVQLPRHGTAVDVPHGDCLR